MFGMVTALVVQDATAAAGAGAGLAASVAPAFVCPIPKTI
jgi:hypothetical protein